MFDSLQIHARRRADYLQRFDLPAESAAFTSAWPAVSASFLVWGQHCFECAAPACYQTCGLYDKGRDHRCQTFVFGIGKNRHLRTLHAYSMECAFKPHAHLFTHLTLPQQPLARIRRWEVLHDRVAAPLAGLLDAPLRAAGRRPIFQRALNRALTQYLYSQEGRLPDPPPDGLLVQIFNPNKDAFDFTIHIYNEPRRPGEMGFQETALLRPGFNEMFIPLEHIGETIDFARSCRISLFPPGQKERFLIVLAAEIVRLAPRPAPPEGRKPVKCVVFDLDNTLWDGILVEGPERLRLKPNVQWLLRRLDQRGVLLSVASKNNHDDAMAALQRFGVSDFFLAPRINWEPKSGNLRRIAEELNIGADTLAFVDDSEFEREEVRHGAPEILVLPETEIPLLTRHPLLRGSESAESAQRRAMMQTEFQRKEHLKALTGGDGDAGGGEGEGEGSNYEKFLRDCRLTLRVFHPEEQHFERIHDLVQRTNQLNFSGNRYDRAELARLIADPKFDTLLLEVSDRFGEYGIVGFALVRRDERAPALTDLALSCRIQAKRIEHAFLLDLMRRCRERGAERLGVLYHKTEKNAPAGRVFDDLGFAHAATEPDGRLRLTRALDGNIPGQDLVAVRNEALPESTGAPSPTLAGS